ncbi:RNA-dependent RNA polymerase [Hubei noda-like virus 8]|uniref:RNA-dependent RNA polymerase n=1 Tax=Hubei noda-like virus 8 TaxID=1922988 RepID=UPI00090B7C5F|nr:RNA-dependent RNA polymerase [Hubei noda-like virus 8]APG76553.1 RNA-dependent RNA polymerase [Hubei noda-like virus 8]
MSRISHFLTGVTYPYGCGRPSPFDVEPRSWNMPYRLAKACCYLAKHNVELLSGQNIRDILSKFKTFYECVTKLWADGITLECAIETVVSSTNGLYLRKPTLKEIRYVVKLYLEALFLIITVPPLTQVQIASLLFDSIASYYGIKAPANRHSFFVEVTSDEPVLDTRRELMLDVVPIRRTMSNHSHPSSAAERSSVHAAIVNKIVEAGYEPFDISMSKSAIEQGLSGQRYFYWLKDYKCSVVEHPIRHSSVIVMVDVDYYLDINEYMKYFRPIVIYTLQPLTLRFVGPEYSFRVDKGEVFYEVRGGAKYSHKIWNYSTHGDTVSVRDWYGNQCVFSVEKQLVGKPDEGSSRHIIYLNPIRRIPWFCITEKDMPLVRHDYTLSTRRPLVETPSITTTTTEKKPDGTVKTITNKTKQKESVIEKLGNSLWDSFNYGVSEGFNYILDPIDNYIELAESNSFTSMRLTIPEFESFLTRAEIKPLKPGDIELQLKKRYSEKKGEAMPYEEIVKTPIIAKILSNVGKTVKGNTTPTNYIQMKQSTTVETANLDSQVFTVEGKDIFFESKLPGQVITSCLVRIPAVLPSRTRNNNQASIMGRISELHNDVVPTVLNHLRFNSAATEFVRLMVPEIGHGVEYSIDQVVAKQDKCAQRQRINEIINTFSAEPTNRLTTFIKNEAYASVNDPRNITTMSSNFTLIASKITYAFKDAVLKQHKWYGPGKTPSESVDLLRNICANGACLTDYSRYDGRVSKWLQNRIAKAAYLRWASPGDTKENVNHMFKEIFRLTGRTADGELYYAGHGTRSGSPITTDANTMINAYIAFCALLYLGYDSKTSFALLGLYAGDDGVTPYIPGIETALYKVCTALGMVVKLEVSPIGEEINYLGRIFPNILVSDISYQDIKRTLPKLHISTNQQVKREVAAVNKALGYLTTDAITPIIGSWAKRVLDLNPDVACRNFLSEELFKIENGAWPQPTQPEDLDLIVESICKHLDMTPSELECFDEAIRTSDTLCTHLDYFDIVWENEVEHKRPAYLNGEIVGTGQPSYTVGLTPATNINQCQINQLITPPPPSKIKKEKEKKKNASNKKKQQSSGSISPEPVAVPSTSEDFPQIATHSRSGTGSISSSSDKQTTSSSPKRERKLSPKSTKKRSEKSKASRTLSTPST